MSQEDPSRPDTPEPAPKAAPSDALLPGSMRSAETEQQISRAQHGDSAALNDLFARYHGIMVDLANRRLGPRLRRKEEADDLAQTTFREAARDFPRYEFRGEGSFLRWLMQILQNKIRDKAEYYSATKRDVSRESSTEDLLGRADEAPRYDPEARDLSVTQTLAREEEFAILRTALDDLSPDHRAAITLVFFQGLSLRDAGERMGGRSEDAVRMLLRRAEARLRESTRGRLAN